MDYASRFDALQLMLDLNFWGSCGGLFERACRAGADAITPSI
jgi:hypothetical protein